MANFITNYNDMYPDIDNTLNIGSPALRFKDIFLAGNLSDGINTVSVSAILTGPTTAVWGGISGTLTNQSDLVSYLSSNYQPLKGSDDNYVTDAQLVVITNTSGTNTGDQTLGSLGAQPQLNGTGFVKASGTTISYDNSTYLTSLSGAVLTDQSTPQTIGATGARLLKLWATDITVTNAITGSVTGNAGTVTNGVYTTGADTVYLTPGTATSTYQPIVTWGDGLTATGVTASVDYNNTNLKITAAQLNTIQDIATTSAPTFASLTLTTFQGNGVISTAPTITDIGNAILLNFQPTWNATTSATIKTGVYIKQNIGASGVLTNGLKDIHLVNPTITAGGSLDTHYGLYIDSFSGATNNYPIYFAGTGVANGINWSDCALYRNTTATIGLTGSLIVSANITANGSDVQLSKSNVGATNTMSVINTDNTNTASHAKLYTRSGGASGGDALVDYTIAGAQDWATGIDNSDSDAFVIAASSVLGSSNVLRLSTAGAVSIPGTLTATTSITSSNLTAGRIVYVGTAGLLTDASNFTFSGSTVTHSETADGATSNLLDLFNTSTNALSTSTLRLGAATTRGVTVSSIASGANGAGWYDLVFGTSAAATQSEGMRLNYAKQLQILTPATNVVNAIPVTAKASIGGGDVDVWNGATLSANEIHYQSNAASISSEANATTGWTNITGSMAAVDSTDTAPHSGSYCLKETSAGGASRIEYPFTAKVGAMYKISIWAKAGIGTSQDFHGWVGLGTFNTVSISSTSWTEYVFYCVATATTATIRAYGGANTNTLYIDDVSIKEVNGGDLVARGKFTGGGTGGIDIDNAGNLSSDKNLTLGTTNLIANPNWLYFDGNTDYVATAVGQWAELDNATAFTLSFIANFDSVADNSYLFSKSVSTSNRVLVYKTASDLRFYVGDSGKYATLTLTGIVSDGENHHYALVYDNAAGATNADKVKIYIDGVARTLVFTGTIPSAIGDMSSVIGRISENSATIAMHGYIKDFRIYNVGVSAANVMSIFQGSSSVSGMVHRYKLNEGSSVHAWDTGTNPQVGIITGGTWTSKPYTGVGMDMPMSALSLPLGTTVNEGIRFGNDTNLYRLSAGVLKTDGEFLAVGRVREAGTYAEIHFHDASAAQSITNGTTYTKLTAFTDNGASSNCTSDATNDKITITKAGKYRVDFNISAYPGTANLDWFAAIFYDGTEANNIHCEAKLLNANDRVIFVASGIITAAANKDIDLRVRHSGASAANFTGTYGNINVMYLGE